MADLGSIGVSEEVSAHPQRAIVASRIGGLYGIAANFAALTSFNDGKLVGQTRVNGVAFPGVIVECLHRASGVIIAKTVSDSSGNFEIRDVETRQEYLLDFLDPSGGVSYNAIVYDKLIPGSV